MHVFVEVGQRIERDDLLRRLVDMLYTRNDQDFQRGTFRVRGDVVEVIPQYESERAVRIELFGERGRVDRRDRPAARQGHQRDRSAR